MKNKEIDESIKRIKEIVDFYKLNDENNYDYSDDVLISMKNLLSHIEQLEKENQQLKKQKDDVVELIIKLYQKEYNKTSDWWLQEELCNNFDNINIFTDFELERMLGETDVED